MLRRVTVIDSAHGILALFAPSARLLPPAGGRHRPRHLLADVNRQHPLGNACNCYHRRIEQGPSKSTVQGAPWSQRCQQCK